MLGGCGATDDGSAYGGFTLGLRPIVNATDKQKIDCEEGRKGAQLFILPPQEERLSCNRTDHCQFGKLPK